MLPVFTRVQLMQDPLLRNPEWQTHQILRISGGSLMANIDPVVTLVINPWSSLEFQLPPAHDQTG